MKLCRRCCLEKSDDCFYLRGVNKLHSYCKQCVREKGDEWRLSNPEKVKELSRVYSSNVPKEIKVLRVQKSRHLKERRGECLCCSGQAVLGKKNCRPCQEKLNRVHNERSRKFKTLCFDHYGRFCVCCTKEFNHDAFLTLNHINNDGKDHRRELKQRSIYEWVVKNGFPDYLETNCWNCNSGRSVNGGICPHQEK
jgi:hypothetical protein